MSYQSLGIRPADAEKRYVRSSALFLRQYVVKIVLQRAELLLFSATNYQAFKTQQHHTSRHSAYASSSPEPSAPP